MDTVRSHYGELPFSGKSKQKVPGGRRPDAETRETLVVGAGLRQRGEMREMRKKKKRGGVCLACREDTLTENRAE